MAVDKGQLEKAREILIHEIPLSKYIRDNRLGHADTESGKINCPVHDDSSPSFYYDDSLKTCNCFGCSVKGSVVELHYAIKRKTDDRYTQVKAVRDLSLKYKVKLPSLYERSVDAKPKHQLRPSKRRRHSDLNDEVMYKRKIEKLEYQIKFIEDVGIKLKLYKIIDDMWEGKKSPKDVYETLNNRIKNISQ